MALGFWGLGLLGRMALNPKTQTASPSLKEDERFSSVLDSLSCSWGLGLPSVVDESRMRLRFGGVEAFWFTLRGLGFKV